MDDRNDQSAKSATATNGVVESEEVRAQEALLGDTDPSLTSADDVAKALNVDPNSARTSSPAPRPYRNGRSSWPSSRIRWCTC